MNLIQNEGNSIWIIGLHRNLAGNLAKIIKQNTLAALDSDLSSE